MPEVQNHVGVPEPTQSRPAAFSSPVLKALRAATASRHAILDSSMPLANPDAQWSDYIRHLQMLAVWLLPLENWLAGFSDGPQGKQAPAFIRYTDFIRADLDETFIAVDNLWQNAHSQCPDDPAYRWGIGYVVEGSQLGGEFLYKRLANRLAPHPLKYLQCKQAGRWPEFLQAMAREVTTHEQINSACDGAVHAFDALLLQLDVRDNIL